MRTNILFVAAAFILIGAIGYSVYRLWDINTGYAQEAAMHSRLLSYRPTLMPTAVKAADIPTGIDAEAPAAPAAPVVNQGVVDLQAKYQDVVGWLTVPGTAIDHPFAQGKDNDHYLHHNLDGDMTPTGTIFLDYRNHKDLSDFYNIIFGHNMRNGSMFGTLQQFNDPDFFDSHDTYTLFLAEGTYTVEIMAFSVIYPNDAVIYNPYVTTEAERLVFLGYVKNTARHYRDIKATPDQQFITLSTCNYEFNNGRMVLVGRLTAI